MRYNEKPVPFHDGCTPHEDGSYFYRGRRAEKLSWLTGPIGVGRVTAYVCRAQETPRSC